MNGVPRALHLLAILIVGSLLLAACAGAQPPATTAAPRGEIETQKVPVEGGGSYTDVGAAGLAEMLKKKDFPLVNVHIPYEGELAGTELFIPYNQIEANLSKLPADRNARIVLYCRSGSMSAIAARDLVKRGYTDVWNLDGGMIGWKQAGYPVENRGPSR
ncbi:MAG: rhodanese-like domain-containing protein [Chloroflexota bacterium]